METFSALLALCAGNSPVTGEFTSQRPVTRSFDVFFYLHQNKRLSKQSRHRWFETPSHSLWRQCNGPCVAACANNPCEQSCATNANSVSSYTCSCYSGWTLQADGKSCLGEGWFGDNNHDDVTKRKYFPRYWPSVRGIQRSTVNSPHKGGR